MNEELFSSLLGKAVYFLQYIFIPGFFLMFAMGILFFLLARKNPTRKRKAFLFTIFGFIGILFVTYGPLFFLYYSSVESIDTEGILNATVPIGAVIYNIFRAIAEPILMYLTYFGLGYLLLAAKEPFRKRMGYALLLGSPFVWTVIYYAPDIKDYFLV